MQISLEAQMRQQGPGNIDLHIYIPLKQNDSMSFQPETWIFFTNTCTVCAFWFFSTLWVKLLVSSRTSHFNQTKPLCLTAEGRNLLSLSLCLWSDSLSLSLSFPLFMWCLGIYDAGRVLGPLPIIHLCGAHPYGQDAQPSLQHHLTRLIVQHSTPCQDSSWSFDVWQWDNNLTNASVGTTWCLVQFRFWMLYVLICMHNIQHIIWAISCEFSRYDFLTHLASSHVSTIVGDHDRFFSISLPSHLI